MTYEWDFDGDNQTDATGITAPFAGVTSGDSSDRMMFHSGALNGQITVSIANLPAGTFAPNGRLVAYGNSGGDDIDVAGNLSTQAWLYGGDGDDRLKGGAGNDLLSGDDGDDLLVGGSGRDLLVGGNGADRIVGNADEDILIAGILVFDHDLAAGAIMAEWCSERSYETRISNLSAKGTGERSNGNHFLLAGENQTVRDNDLARDVLTGSAGDDWFFFRVSEDRATDLTDEVFANDLAWIG